MLSAHITKKKERDRSRQNKKIPMREKYWILCAGAHNNDRVITNVTHLSWYNNFTFSVDVHCTALRWESTKPVQCLSLSLRCLLFFSRSFFLSFDRINSLSLTLVRKCAQCKHQFCIVFVCACTLARSRARFTKRSLYYRHTCTHCLFC